MGRRWLGCWLALQVALPLHAATPPASAPGTPPPAEQAPARVVVPVVREPSPRATDPTGLRGVPVPAERPPDSEKLPAQREPGPRNTDPNGLPGSPVPAERLPDSEKLPAPREPGSGAPTIRRTGDERGRLLDQSLPPQQWRGIKQSSADAQAPLREWLVFSRNLAEAQSQRLALQPFALSILRRQQLGELGRVISVYRIPDGADLHQLEARLRQEFPDWQQELNLRYLPLSEALEGNGDALERWGQQAIGQVQLSPANCGAGAVLAMLDGPVNPNLAAFAGAALSYQSVVSAAFRPSSLTADRHGNGIAALLVGQQRVRGLIPGARVYALGVFGEDAEVGLHTRTDWLLSGLDRLLALPAPVQVVNLSFGGGYSRLLESSIQRLQSRMKFVAAAGNDGFDSVRYPAAYPGVVAVGAVDARLQRQRQSNYGPGLSLVAPGEDIWTLDEHGQGYFASGTSLAAPFVSAALALGHSAKQLRAQARDIGPAGIDLWYGAGLVQMPGCH